MTENHGDTRTKNNERLTHPCLEGQQRGYRKRAWATGSAVTGVKGGAAGKTQGEQEHDQVEVLDPDQ